MHGSQVASRSNVASLGSVANDVPDGTGSLPIIYNSHVHLRQSRYVFPVIVSGSARRISTPKSMHIFAPKRTVVAGRTPNTSVDCGGGQSIPPRHVPVVFARAAGPHPRHAL